MKIQILDIEGFYKVLNIEGLSFGASGFLAIKSLKSGICTGGLRISNSVDIKEVLSLAVSMELKFKLYDLPVGGAKSGICIQSHLSKSKKDQVLKEFALAIKDELISHYFIGPDLGSTSQDIDILYKSIKHNQMVLSKKLLKKTSMNSLLFLIPDFLLKFIPTGYSSYGGKLTGMGLVTSLKASVKIIEGQSLCIHGAGQVAKGILESLICEDVKILGICDIDQGVKFPNGISPKKLLHLLANNQLFEDRYLKIDPKDILFMDVDVLVLASGSNIISIENQSQVKAKVILEGANNTMSVNTEKLLHSKGVRVVPDFASNSAISVSFGLMITNQLNPYFKKRLINTTLEFMEEKMNLANEISRKKKISLREYFFGLINDSSIDYLKNEKNL